MPSPKKSTLSLRSFVSAFVLSAAMMGLAASIPSDSLHAATLKEVKFASGRILVKPKPGLDTTKFLGILAKHGGKSDRKLEQIGVHIVKVPPGLEKKIVAELAANPGVDFAELDQLVKADFTPNDSHFGSQWHHAKIGSQTAWDNSSADGITIAILDTGVDVTHPDLAASIVPGRNIVNQNTDVSDINGHGTAVAGVAAAVFDNAIGVSGVARGAKIMPVRITNDSTSYAYWSDINNGALWAVDNGARVISNSYSSWNSSTSASTSNYIRSKGGLFIACAGNEGTLISGTTFPDTSQIVVSATDSADVKTSWSNYGPIIDVSAPGLNILTTTRGGGYASWWGTSFSTPMTSGLIAMIMGANPQLSPNDVETILETTATDLGAVGKDDLYGNGRINAAAAISLAKTYVPTVTDTTLPTVSVASPVAGATVAGLVPVDVNATDNVGLARVDLMVNGALYASDTMAPFSFVWDTTSLGNLPSVTISAVAVDTSGNQKTSTGVSVKVQNIVDTVPPVSAILSPANGARVSGTVTITGSASDNVGLASMDLLIDGRIVRTVTTGTISYSWNTKREKAGSHSITLRAKDTSGNIGAGTISVVK